jgi:hypothetical protein
VHRRAEGGRLAFFRGVGECERSFISLFIFLFLIITRRIRGSHPPACWPGHPR